MDDDHVDDGRAGRRPRRDHIWVVATVLVGALVIVPAVAARSWLLVVGTLVLTGLALAAAWRVVAVGRELARVLADGADLTRRLTWDATHDDLTGLVNRGGLDAAVTRRAIAAHGDVTAMLIDLDRFKRINDELGHLAGDAVLRVAARRLRATFRPEDMVTRPGGDEFLVLLASTPSRSELRRLAGRAIDALERPIAVGTVMVTISASIGMSTLAASEATLPLLIADCDEALYEAKRGGRGRAVDAGTDRHIS